MYKDTTNRQHASSAACPKRKYECVEGWSGKSGLENLKADLSDNFSPSYFQLVMRGREKREVKRRKREREKGGKGKHLLPLSGIAIPSKEKIAFLFGT